ncbi:MAG: hypothetical protein COU67_02825 [Candidatus Pacebacteria bacterium CG10_big_fil_rev_8_21_14_0_10_44_54]|nr:MAG: hypothetical protein COU67_02825 [Candidatus Pacebacteria bacterium CG10_big_fil_rev_8_21_14_0_10_44_54]
MADELFTAHSLGVVFLEKFVGFDKTNRVQKFFSSYFVFIFFIHFEYIFFLYKLCFCSFSSFGKE